MRTLTALDTLGFGYVTFVMLTSDASVPGKIIGALLMVAALAAMWRATYRRRH